MTRRKVTMMMIHDADGDDDGDDVGDDGDGDIAATQAVHKAQL